jgi:hypothetical protein
MNGVSGTINSKRILFDACFHSQQIILDKIRGLYQGSFHLRGQLLFGILCYMCGCVSMHEVEGESVSCYRGA